MIVGLSFVKAIAVLAAIFLGAAGAVVLLGMFERHKAPPYIAFTGVAGFLVVSGFVTAAVMRIA
jgi:hypothetical protein